MQPRLGPPSCPPPASLSQVHSQDPGAEPLPHLPFPHLPPSPSLPCSALSLSHPQGSKAGAPGRQGLWLLGDLVGAGEGGEQSPLPRRPPGRREGKPGSAPAEHRWTGPSCRRNQAQLPRHQDPRGQRLRPPLDPQPPGGASPLTVAPLTPGSQPLSQKQGHWAGPPSATYTPQLPARPVWGAHHSSPQVTQPGAQVVMGRAPPGRPGPGAQNLPAGGGGRRCQGRRMPRPLRTARSTWSGPEGAHFQGARPCSANQSPEPSAWSLAVPVAPAPQGGASLPVTFLLGLALGRVSIPGPQEQAFQRGAGRARGGVLGRAPPGNRCHTLVGVGWGASDRREAGPLDSGWDRPPPPQLG